uniref:Uncharacterized protein n=1 Tax=Candidatus Kentrum sp. TUN TaxID=2126343 RepID=A0A451ABE0_9GAMM|nr:MAG: hypothetical protein BECKTUN1418D_GA0071000_12091 [Candidatus Kentron sp. TUN]
MRVLIEQQVPQVFIALPVKAFTDNVHPVTQGDLTDLHVPQSMRPAVQPMLHSAMIPESVVKHGHQVRLILAPLPFKGNGPALGGTCRLDGLEHIMGWVGDAQKILRGNLRGARVVLVGQFDSRTLQVATFELVT